MSPLERYNVLFLASSKSSGLTFNFVRLAIALKRFGHKIIVVSGLKEQEKGLFKELAQRGLQCFRLDGIDNFSLFNIMSAISKISKIIKEYNINLIHAQGIYQMLLVFVASKLSRSNGAVKIAVSIHSTLHGRRFESLAPYIMSVFLNIFADRIMPVSSCVAEKLIKLGVASDKVVTIHNGIDIEFFDKVLSNRRYAPSLPLNFNSQSDTLVGYSANMIPHKGHKYLLLALYELLKETPNIRLVLTSDGPVRGELESLSKKLGIAQNVWFTGKIEYKELYHLLKMVNIYAFPSLAELFPFALIEAMASEKPIVATKVGGVPEMVFEGENGILVPSGDTESLVSALKELVNDKPRAQMMGRKSRKLVEEKFNLSQIANNFSKCYELCMRKHNIDPVFLEDTNRDPRALARARS